MNLLQQFNAIFKNETRSVAKITVKTETGYIAQTQSGNEVRLRGSSYNVGDNVFYERSTGAILETAPDLPLVELRVL
ncbi:hypothetical protein [Kingella negevensis]|uniref:hypothetical protein n=1 Tax=Kingella negevensis TaxID=1522312 RepID=UPI000A26CECF|nr:hypothetical protein [Kingella negevensis]WII91776.1 hypothetical protein QEO93_04105 [Kingella negevensis]